MTAYMNLAYVTNNISADGSTGNDSEVIFMVIMQFYDSGNGFNNPSQCWCASLQYDNYHELNLPLKLGVFSRKPLFGLHHN